MLDGSWPGWGLLQTSISAASGLLGAIIGGSITVIIQKTSGKQTHMKEQLERFYSPMMSALSVISAKRGVAETASKKAEEYWNSDRPWSEGLNWLDKSNTYEFLNQYLVRLHADDLCPIYSAMLKIFSENLWLAEPSTRSYYMQFTEFVERWYHVEVRSGHSVQMPYYEDVEEPNDFYDDLQFHFERLRGKIAS